MNTDPNSTPTSEDEVPEQPGVEAQIKELRELVQGLRASMENLQGDVLSKVYEQGVKDSQEAPPTTPAPVEETDPTYHLRAEIEELKTQMIQKDLKSAITETAGAHQLHPSHLAAHILTQFDIQPTTEGGFHLSRGGQNVGSLENYVTQYANSEEGRVISIKHPPAPTGASQGGQVAQKPLDKISVLKRMYPHLS